ncbi:nitrite reductase small subunit NirD [Actinomycetospora endophytica]|uniref:Nitrite reductase small subunit NirD n=1 Tax=Actinomycetospora endophytica TaxID=2291215 RepID=A0ABS8PAE4_9PSEU|nr:nitrite reductase small subunit NirD [Actinomycetospora endophytica]MCD2194381.1 nitrite reductase small subunit NirD [Actinomycetospora endophytica]
MTAQADVRLHPAGTTAGAEAKDPRPDPGVPTTPEPADGWTPICPLERLQRERGVGALVGGEPVAVFRTHDDALYALHNVDPFSGASVLSRGIVGDLAGTPVVASPLFKQHFALDTGTAVEDPTVTVATYPVRVVDGTVEVGGA